MMDGPETTTDMECPVQDLPEIYYRRARYKAVDFIPLVGLIPYELRARNVETHIVRTYDRSLPFYRDMIVDAVIGIAYGTDHLVAAFLSIQAMWDYIQ